MQASLSTIDELRALIDATDESDTIEFKEDWTSKVTDAIAAFSNTRGGRIFVGVRDAGPKAERIVGLSEKDSDPAQASTHVDQIKPHPSWRLGPKLPHESGRYVVQILVEAGPNPPYYCRGQTFLRRLPGKNAHMEREEIEDAFAGRMEQVQRLRLLVAELVRIRNLVFRAVELQNRREAEILLTPIDAPVLAAIQAAPPGLLRGEDELMGSLQGLSWRLDAYNARLSQAQAFVSRFYWPGPGTLPRLDRITPGTTILVSAPHGPTANLGENVCSYLAAAALPISRPGIEAAARRLASILGASEPVFPSIEEIFRGGAF